MSGVAGPGDDLVIRSRRVVLPDGERPAAVAVRDGVITAVLDHDRPVEARVIENLGTDALLPGLVDSHVHINDPGRSDWEGFPTATAAAVAGSITTLVDMPLNSLPPTVDPATLAVKAQAAAGRCAVDIDFWGGAVPENLGRLGALHAAGICGFKAFMVDSGVPEFEALSTEQLGTACAEVAALDSTLLVHAEDPGVVDDSSGGSGYDSFLNSGPDLAEVRAVETVAELALRTGARVHILHVSSMQAAHVVGRSRRLAVRISAETCPHYLSLRAEDVPDVRTEFKCCLLIRDAANQQGSWRVLVSGEIDAIVSDHSPAPPALKPTGDFATAWGGIASLQVALPLVWTEAVAWGQGLSEVVRWMGRFPAGLAGLGRKGSISVGCDADLVRFDPDSEWVVRTTELEHRHAVSPYEGRRCRGVVRAVWLRGRLAEKHSNIGHILIGDRNTAGLPL